MLQHIISGRNLFHRRGRNHGTEHELKESWNSSDALMTIRHASQKTMSFSEHTMHVGLKVAINTNSSIFYLTVWRELTLMRGVGKYWLVSIVLLTARFHSGIQVFH